MIITVVFFKKNANFYLLCLVSVFVCVCVLACVVLVCVCVWWNKTKKQSLKFALHTLLNSLLLIWCSYLHACAHTEKLLKIQSVSWHFVSFVGSSAVST